MIDNVKNVFSIKDLENLSGIKAHTIRIWEKRYNILSPMRTDTNIRLYDLEGLQKLLNITLLHQYGYKISKIATYPEDKIPELVKETVNSRNSKNHAVNALKMAMMNFDQELFFNTYNWLAEDKSFKEIFIQVFIPLLNEIGLLWQTDTISPAHEHFISYLIRHKLILNIEKLQVLKPVKTEKVFVLSLPMNEIHELGLMYLHYEILQKGFRAIYLGESMPVKSLKDLKKHFDSITFISYLTVKPNRNEIDDFVREMTEELLDDTTEIWYTGSLASLIITEGLPENISVFNSVTELTERI